MTDNTPPPLPPATPGGEVLDEVRARLSRIVPLPTDEEAEHGAAIVRLVDRLRADLAAARERLAILDALDDRAMESAAASMDDRANTISRLTHTGPTCDARLEMSRQRDDLRRRAAVVRAALSATRGTTETPHE